MSEQIIEASGPSVEILPKAEIVPLEQHKVATDEASADKPLESADMLKRKRLKKMRIGDALRVEGLDERDVAQKFREVIERQIPKSEGQETNDKLLVDMLLNCFRYLDDGPGPGVGGRALRPPRLLHNVPRPRRTLITKTKTGKDS
ncbi:MAG TPA: hypothetical protein VMB47_12415 [Candidatus Aquilonibacter sp.]|nr:hypothetical protein [Candidatus Aquilonibacter sp.]